ncbi:hypothetical protein Tsubulata_001843 [Turnera subulata]|uniref:Late embryogenesis abundant protein LEA-2 subgroup domain-containing protein n=1 Tax=Turnera subulata TaxID=218843 RepID=A0A9Q0G3E5_9ROSI|nr:hypothetical protein Tsubulata_001843 [Turnera subulata]
MGSDRIHPRADSPPATAQPPSSPRKPAPPGAEKPVPQPTPGTYVIQIPKDQIYRVPPPDHASRYRELSRRKPRRGCCACLFCTLLILLVSLVLLAAVAAGVFYFVVRPQAPKYSVQSLSVKGLNLSSPAPYSPEFDASVRADNPNAKIGIYYDSGSSVEVFYEGVRFGSGSLPVLYQGPKNVTVLSTAVKGKGIELTMGMQRALVDDERKGTVPLTLNLRVPVRIKVGSVKTWEIKVKVNCDVTLDELTPKAKVVSKKCDYGVNLWN